YDATGTLLFRLDEMRYHSPITFDSAKWPVLAVDPGKELSSPLYFSPSHGFGPLPPGKYSLRVYFPFDEGEYYPVQLVSGGPFRPETSRRAAIGGRLFISLAWTSRCPSRRV